jgi:hypothetical protein
MKEQNKVNKSKYLTGKQTLIVFWIGILVILFACINSYYNPNLLWNNTTSNNSNTQITSWRCNYEMKEEIKKNYKSPSTVEFVECNWDRSRWTYWEIWGEIDSQNWFGAIVRSSFTCSDEVWCIITQR